MFSTRITPFRYLGRVKCRHWVEQLPQASEPREYYRRCLGRWAKPLLEQCSGNIERDRSWCYWCTNQRSVRICGAERVPGQDRASQGTYSRRELHKPATHQRYHHRYDVAVKATNAKLLWTRCTCRAQIAKDVWLHRRLQSKWASVSGAESGAERAENRLERSRAVSGQRRGSKRWSMSGARSWRSRSGNGAESGLNRLRSAHSPLQPNYMCIVRILLSPLPVFTLYSSLFLSLFRTWINLNCFT